MFQMTASPGCVTCTSPRARCQHSWTSVTLQDWSSKQHDRPLLSPAARQHTAQHRAAGTQAGRQTDRQAHRRADWQATHAAAAGASVVDAAAKSGGSWLQQRIRLQHRQPNCSCRDVVLRVHPCRNGWPFAGSMQFGLAVTNCSAISSCW